MEQSKKLSTKITAGLVILSVLLTLGVCIAVGILYWKNSIKEYSTLSFNYTRTAADLIDGDRVLHYLDTLEKDSYYQEIQDFLNSSQKETGLYYYYVFVPYDNDLVYIWDADNYEGACPLGYREEYMDGGREIAEKVFCKDPVEEISISHDEKYGYIASAYSPVFNSSGDPVALVGADIQMPDIIENTVWFISIIATVIILFIILSMLSLYCYVNKKIVSPINTLNKAAREFVCNIESNNAFHSDIHTGDEIEALADSFEQLDTEITEYIQRLSQATAEKERFESELNVARQIQAAFLPANFPELSEHNKYSIYATMDPAREVGGDFYDFFMVDETHLAIVVADVSGKGIPASLFMVIAKTLIKDHTSPGKDPGDVFTEINSLLCESNTNNMFVTAFEGILNLSTGEMKYVNAGHEVPYICQYGKTYEPNKFSHGIVLAAFEDYKYSTGCITLRPGDKFFQYTDGVPEAINSGNEAYGTERMENVLRIHSNKSPYELLKAVKEDIGLFIGDTSQFDDITMLCLEYRPDIQK